MQARPPPESGIPLLHFNAYSNNNNNNKKNKNSDDAMVIKTAASTYSAVALTQGPLLAFSRIHHLTDPYTPIYNISAHPSSRLAQLCSLFSLTFSLFQYTVPPSTLFFLPCTLPFLHWGEVLARQPGAGQDSTVSWMLAKLILIHIMILVPCSGVQTGILASTTATDFQFRSPSHHNNDQASVIRSTSINDPFVTLLDVITLHTPLFGLSQSIPFLVITESQET